MKNQKTSWRVRRFVMFVITGFCMTVIWRVVDSGVDNETASTAIKCSFWVLFSVLAIYVFGVISDEQIGKLIDAKFRAGKDS